MTTTPPIDPQRKQIFPSPLRGLEPAQKKSDKLIHGSLRTICKEPVKLARWVQLHHALPTAPFRQEVLEQVRAVWTQVQKQLTACVANETIISDAKASLNQMKCKFVSQIYLGELDKPGSLFEKAKHCLKDVDSVPCCPVTRSTRGNKGPTFIVSYPTSKGMRKHVQKWTHLNELMSNALYSKFSTCFADDLCCGFLVPKTARLDFRSCLHESASGNVTRFDKSLSQTLARSYVDLAKTMDSSLEPQADHLMFAELVRGQNILDFSYSEYENLSLEQRLKLFERLGRIAMLDLVFGNLDRLIQVNVNYDEEYCLEDALEVNLGNVMIVSEQDPLLFAIDNGIDPELIENPNHRKKYLAFLEKLFSTEDPYSILTQNFVQCFQNALSSQIDDVEYVQVEEEKGVSTPTKANVSVLREKMQPMVIDLQRPEFQREIRKGMCKMSAWMRDVVVPTIWSKNHQAIALQVYLKRHYPKYLDAIQERMFAFAKLTSEVK